MRLARVLGFFACLPMLLAGPARASDAVPTGIGGTVSLGSNWGPYETFKGTSFRWVDNDAEIVMHGGNGIERLAISCEGGPSLGQTAFALRALDPMHRQVDHVVCGGQNHPVQLLLPLSGSETRYVLHADGGGRPVAGEKRILNFRVFSLDDGRGGGAGGDVVDPRNGVRLGEHWFPLEHFRDQTFRWMDGNDAQVFVTSDRPQRTSMRLLVELGPGIGAKQATLTARDRSGRTIARTTVRGRQTVLVPVDLVAGENEYFINVTSRNKPVSGDARILNLRLFSAAALR